MPHELRVKEFVYPQSASVLHGRDIYQLESNNLLINFTLDTAYVVPERLCTSRLQDALARTLSRFPLFCGTLLRDPIWAIVLTSLRPVPLFKRHEPKNSPELHEREAVVVPRPGPLIEKLDPLKLLSGVEPELLKVTIVTTESTTLLGISSSHILGDHTMVMKFLRTWSQYFTEHLAPVVETIPEYDLPLHIDMPSNRERVAYMRSKLTPILFHTFPLENIPYSIFSPFPVNRVDVYLTGQQVLVLYQRLSLLFRDFLASRALSSEDFKEVVKLSRQDVLSAFIVTAISVSRGEPITQVTNVVNCRGFNPAIVPEDAAGNALLYALTDIVQSPGLDRESLGGTIISYAHAIRLSLQAAREPQYVHDFLALAGQEWLAAARANRGHYIAETPGHVVINSYYRIDWASVHFGSPGKVCWQHPDHIMTDNYIMMFPSNPIRGNHGVWRTDDGACEMTFNVKKGMEETLEVALALLWDVVVGSPSGPAFKTSQVAF